MKRINLSGKAFALIVAVFLFISNRGTGQTGMPEILTTGTLQEQLNYVQEHTLIYENYRAIREDMFQKIKENASDSLSAAKTKINGLKNFTFRLNGTIDSLNGSLGSTKNSLEEITKTKNSIRLFGIEVNKISYNAIMWMIIAGLLTLLAMGFIAFKRNMIITVRTKKEFEELKNEFEAYRKTAREAREKMSMAHFNEIKKLKGG
jgi:wyosine [tRNA(Phe)-imidazoG37] synthetase (radical SAM superfamily)